MSRDSFLKQLTQRTHLCSFIRISISVCFEIWSNLVHYTYVRTAVPIWLLINVSTYCPCLPTLVSLWLVAHSILSILLVMYSWRTVKDSSYPQSKRLLRFLLRRGPPRKRSDIRDWADILISEHTLRQRRRARKGKRSTELIPGDLSRAAVIIVIDIDWPV